MWREVRGKLSKVGLSFSCHLVGSRKELKLLKVCTQVPLSTGAILTQKPTKQQQSHKPFESQLEAECSSIPLRPYGNQKDGSVGRST